MAHFANIDENGIVLEVQVINNDDIDGGTFSESEPVGQAYQASLGVPGTWLQCSYSGSFRGAYPGPGWTYDTELDEFIAPPTPEPIEETP
jgi:hypothetical protein